MANPGPAFNDFQSRTEDAASPPRFLLRLYITGTTALSNRAVVNVRKICEEHISGSYDLEVIDVARHTEQAAKDQIIAIPTLVKILPVPSRRMVGDMSRTQNVLAGLGLSERSK